MNVATSAPDESTADRPDKVTIYGESGDWRWTRRAPNGVVIGASTESYVKKADARANIARTQGGNYVIVT